MSKFVISGPSKLEGEIEVYGAKNAAMKMIAAAVLIPGKVILKNVPDILDIQNIIEMLTKNNAVITREGHTLTIDTTNLTNQDPDQKLVEKMRGSIVLVGPYLARFGKIKIPQPGGCNIGARPIDIHVDAFRQMGVAVDESNLTEFKVSTLTGRPVNFRGVSVTATENILMAAVKAKGETLITNAAAEPEIKDLADFLNSAGAQIEGAGTGTIRVVGVASLKPVEYTVMPDKIEAATFITLSLMTASPLKVTNIRLEDLQMFISKVAEMGGQFETAADSVYVKKAGELKPVEVETAVYPGFATDWQPLIGLLATKANGTSHIKETIWENRLGYLKELKDMGARAEVLNPQEAMVIGPTPLHGAKIESLDLRSGVTLILAGLYATGETIIADAEIIDRGYEKIEERLQKVGAKIQRLP